MLRNDPLKMKKLLTSFLILATFALFSPGIVSARQVQLYQKHLFTDSNLVSYWRMEGNSNDSKGTNNGSDISVTYGTQYGIFGQGGYYNGSAYTTIPDNAALSPATMTLAVWMNPTSIPSNSFNRIIDKRNGNYGWHFGIKTDGGYNGLYWEAGNGSSISTWIWNYSLSINTWYFVVFTQTGTTVNLYVNGVNAGTPALSGSTGIANASGEPLYFGKGTDGGQYSGYCDDVSIFNRVLSASEIAQLYTSRSLEGNGISR